MQGLSILQNFGYFICENKIINKRTNTYVSIVPSSVENNMTALLPTASPVAMVTIMGSWDCT